MHKGKIDILTKGRIEWAIAQAKSARQAAKILKIDRKTFRKYAEMYGLYEQIKNPSGKGIPRAWNLHSGRFALDDIIKGLYPTYPPKKLQDRLISSGYIPQRCSSCGFEEERLTDRKVPLRIDFLDDDSTNHRLENIRMLCFNCFFLSVGNLSGRKKS
tara:strand:- start:752 stop:1225 length:474 start_codon:yes stop_codon:yes gene_type:complete